MLDVDPAVIPLWDAAERDAATKKLLQTDPAERAADEHEEIEDAIAEINRRLAKPDLGDRSYTNLMAQKTKLLDQRAKLLERYGLDKFVVDERDKGTKLIHEAMAEVLGPVAHLVDECAKAGFSLSDLLLADRRPEPEPAPDPEPELDPEEAELEDETVS